MENTTQADDLDDDEDLGEPTFKTPPFSQWCPPYPGSQGQISDSLLLALLDSHRQQIKSLKESYEREMAWQTKTHALEIERQAERWALQLQLEREKLKKKSGA